MEEDLHLNDTKDGRMIRLLSDGMLVYRYGGGGNCTGLTRGTSLRRTYMNGSLSSLKGCQECAHIMLRVLEWTSGLSVTNMRAADSLSH